MNQIKDSLRYNDVLKTIKDNIEKIPIEQLEEVLEKNNLTPNRI